MVSLKIEVRKKDVTWAVLLVAVLVVGVVYAYGTSNPSVMGHSADEIEGLGNLATKDSVSWSEISGMPASFADGVDNEGSRGVASWGTCTYVSAAYAANCPANYFLVSMDRHACTHVSGKSGGGCWAKCCKILIQ